MRENGILMNLCAQYKIFNVKQMTMPDATLWAENTRRLKRKDFFKFLGMFCKSSLIEDWNI